MDGEKITGGAGSAGPLSEGGDVAATTRDPDRIQREIEQTRAELAETIDAIADRISPKRAASRGAAAVRAQVASVLGGGSDGSVPGAVIDAPRSATSPVDSTARRADVRQIAQDNGGARFTGTGEYTVARSLRTDRVLIVVGALAAVAGLIVLRRSRH